MSLKNWILHGVHRMNGLAARGDLPESSADAHAPSPAASSTPSRAAADRGRRFAGREPTLASAEHLGAYAPLIDAIRDELEHFVASHVRLHLAIAERDRFLLTAIGIGCEASEEARRLLQQFVREFKPEQVKRYLAREVIGGLPNAAAIDLSQFAGLFDADAARAAKEEAEGGEYRELLEALRAKPAAPLPGYRVSVLGRWVEGEATRASPASPVASTTPGTPLSGQRCEFDVEDGSGRRRVVLHGVVPGRRYVVGNGEGSDIRVEGTFASRRHAEVWLEDGAWWVADAGSTNGVRIEPAAPLQRGAAAPTAVGDKPLRLANGLRIVLSARAEGPASEYPWLALRPPASGASLVTPIATATGTLRTPRTAILAARAAPNLATPTTQILPAAGADTAAMRLTLSHAAGVRTLPLVAAALPVSVGRSRHQTLVVDRGHEGVSGHHLDIVELDPAGACVVVVHGDNGVRIDGARHAPGARVRWQAGQKLVLGDASEAPVPCVLELASPHGEA
ncbi:MAG: FHA domain-containing protein [Burkholderiales bacterium]|nr:FHA domain-containing protein [Burkholderiales bacterium]